MKLFTRTVCPKCMLVKMELDSAGHEYEIINIDHDEKAKQEIVNNGYMTVPVLQYEDTFIGDEKAILSWLGTYFEAI